MGILQELGVVVRPPDLDEQLLALSTGMVKAVQRIQVQHGAIVEVERLLTAFTNPVLFQAQAAVDEIAYRFDELTEKTISSQKAYLQELAFLRTKQRVLDPAVDVAVEAGGDVVFHDPVTCLSDDLKALVNDCVKERVRQHLAFYQKEPDKYLQALQAEKKREQASKKPVVDHETGGAGNSALFRKLQAENEQLAAELKEVQDQLASEVRRGQNFESEIRQLRKLLAANSAAGREQQDAAQAQQQSEWESILDSVRKEASKLREDKKIANGKIQELTSEGAAQLTKIQTLLEANADLNVALEDLRSKLYDLKQMAKKHGLDDLLDAAIDTLGKASALARLRTYKCEGEVFERLYKDAVERWDRFKARMEAESEKTEEGEMDGEQSDQQKGARVSTLELVCEGRGRAGTDNSPSPRKGLTSPHAPAPMKFGKSSANSRGRTSLHQSSAPPELPPIVTPLSATKGSAHASSAPSLPRHNEMPRKSPVRGAWRVGLLRNSGGLLVDPGCFSPVKRSPFDASI
mmetsp:Transcript_50519/g.110526  ORF Transcript_50519/g.110526 Transcript_50519/m.110526 type:complete len:519 (-) Transcript_50519:599-2155(-)